MIRGFKRRVQRKVFVLLSVTWSFLTWTDGLQLRRASDAKAGPMASPPSAEGARFGGGFRVSVSAADSVKTRRTGQKSEMEVSALYVKI